MILSSPSLKRAFLKTLVIANIIAAGSALCAAQELSTSSACCVPPPAAEPAAEPAAPAPEPPREAAADEESRALSPARSLPPFSPYSEAVEYYLRGEPSDSQLPSVPPMFEFSLDPQKEKTREARFNWDGAVKQSLLFLAGQHSLRLAVEPDTRAGLKGSFWKDYFKTVASLRGWDDGDTFATNYIGHPMMGAVSGFIQIHNDPGGSGLEVDSGEPYRKSRMKAFAWSALYSLQFELGLLSEASIGNVGLTPRNSSKHPMAFVDLVVTPVVGTTWVIGEDALDRYVIARFEKWSDNHVMRVLVRSWLNPSRSIANLLRFKKPWRRDTRQM